MPKKEYIKNYKLKSFLRRAKRDENKYQFYYTLLSKLLPSENVIDLEHLTFNEIYYIRNKVEKLNFENISYIWEIVFAGNSKPRINQNFQLLRWGCWYFNHLIHLLKMRRLKIVEFYRQLVRLRISLIGLDEFEKNMLGSSVDAKWQRAGGGQLNKFGCLNLIYSLGGSERPEKQDVLADMPYSQLLNTFAYNRLKAQIANRYHNTK
jgi:hypothetical protein